MTYPRVPSRRASGLAALALLLSSTASQVGAAPHLSFTTLFQPHAEQRPTTYGYVARDAVSSLNSSAAGLALWGHAQLDLDARGPLARAAYLLTAGQAVLRFQWANSMYFGHETMHFSAAHAHGRDLHYFRDDNSGDTLSGWQAYSRIFLSGEVGGPAVSGASRALPSSADPDHDRVEADVAGLNWQMSYSEARVRDQLLREDGTVFDGTDLLLNRSYTLSYSLGDMLRAQDGGKQGDPARWADHVEARTGARHVLERSAVIAAAASLFSPTMVAALKSLSHYVVQGHTALDVRFVEQDRAKLTWDLPHYMNPESFSLAPMLYWSQDASAPFAADRLVLGGGFELPIIGHGNVEGYFTLDGIWGNFELGTGVALGPEGAFVHLEAGYALSDHLVLTAGGAVSSGATLRGARDFPDGTAEAWAGLSLRF